MYFPRRSFIIFAFFNDSANKLKDCFVAFVINIVSVIFILFLWLVILGCFMFILSASFMTKVQGCQVIVPLI